jgi:hypothetical protein
MQGTIPEHTQTWVSSKPDSFFLNPTPSHRYSRWLTCLSRIVDNLAVTQHKTEPDCARIVMGMIARPNRPTRIRPESSDWEPVGSSARIRRCTRAVLEDVSPAHIDGHRPVVYDGFAKHGEEESTLLQAGEPSDMMRWRSDNLK